MPTVSAPIRWTPKLCKLAELKPYEHNPRKMSKVAFENLKKSLSQDGYHQRLIATQDLTIVGGHQRLRALKELGILEVEVLVPDRKLTTEEFDRINVRDNLPFGDFDFDILANRFDPNTLIDWGMPEHWLPSSENAVNEASGDVDEAAIAPKKPKTVKGDIYEIGGHRLICGDSTFIDDIKKLMNGQLADQLLTDPPYNVAYEGKTKDALKIKNDSMDNDKFRQFLVDAFRCADIALKPGAVFYIWHADSEGFNFRGACADIGWKVRQCLIWKKNTIVMGRQDYHWQHEPCLYGWKEGAGHLWASDRKQSTLLEFDKPSRNGEHPTMKPVALFAYQVANNTKEQDLVLDLFGGSGTSMVAAHQLNRRAYLCELDPAYCDVIVDRMVKLYPDLPLKLNGKPVKWSSLS